MLNEIYRMLDPVAFAVGPFIVRWYGIAYVAGFVCAALVLWRVAKRWKVRVDADSLLTVVLCAIIGVILGGRLGYVLVYGDGYYFSHPAEILAFNHGGMSFHGGLIGALLSGIVAARFTGIPYLTLADMGCIAAPIGLFFGRCANFVNGELWGAPTSLPWGVVFGSSTRPCSRALCCSACYTSCRASNLRVLRGRFWACSLWAMACSASSSSSFASPMRKSATYGADG